MNYLSKIKAFLELTRMKHGLMLALAVIVGQLVTLGKLPVNKILIPSLITPILISAGAMAINDYMDYEADKKNNRKDRPLVTGTISKKATLLTALILPPAGIISAYYINLQAVTIALIFTALSYSYAVNLKKILLIGNVSIAASMAIPFIFGAVTVSNQVPIAIWILSTMAFLSGTGREIVKSIQDMKGDKEQGRRTLPIVAGKKKSTCSAVMLILTAIAISPVPYLKLQGYLGSIPYILTVTVANVVFILALHGLIREENYEKFRKLSLIAMAIALIAFLAPLI